MTRPVRSTIRAAWTAAAVTLLATVAQALPIVAISLADIDAPEHVLDALPTPLFSTPPHRVQGDEMDAAEAISTTSAQPEPSIVISSVPAQPPPLSVTTWTPPGDFADLSSFGLKKFAYGQENLALVVGELPILGPLVAQLATAATAAVNDSDVSSVLDDTVPEIDPSTSDDETETEPQEDDGDMSPDTISPPVDAQSDDDVSDSPTPSWSSPNGTMFQLRYPAGSVNPGSDPQGGADFYAVPPSLKSILPAARNVTLEYSVYFPEDFDWVKGGKLPGLYGGHESCSGGDDAESCFSTRMMWRPGGEGEIYLYAPRDKQASNVCATPPKTVCDSVYGMSLGRGSFAFALGGWTRITQTVVLNTPGSPDGSLDLDVNGQRVMSVQGVYYRNAPSASTPQVPVKRQEPATATTDSRTTTDTSASMTAAAAAASQAPARWRPPIVVFDEPSRTQAVGFTGLFFSTFFGGHEQDYATPKDQFTYFGDFVMTVNS